MKSKRRARAWVVFMLAPINVRVLAETAAEAEAIALDRMNNSGAGLEVDDNDAMAVWMDGSGWDIDPTISTAKSTVKLQTIN